LEDKFFERMGEVKKLGLLRKKRREGVKL